MSKDLIFYKKAKNSILPDNLDWFLARCDSSNYTTKENIKLPGYLVDANNEVQYYGIYNKAFYGEEKIKELRIPKTISYIGASAFGRSSIEKIYFYSVAPRMDLSKDVFEGMDLAQLQILVPSGTKSNYYIQSWIDACGGEDNWNTIVQEGNHFSDEEIRPLHLYGRSDIESFNAADVVIESMGQMAFLGTDFTNEQANNKGIELSEDSLVTYNVTNKTVFYDKALYRSMPDTKNILNNDIVPNTLKPNSLYKNTGLVTNNEYQPQQLFINTAYIDDFALQNANDGRPFELYIGPDVTYISPYAFWNCNIVKIGIVNSYIDESYITTPGVLATDKIQIYYKEFITNDPSYDTGYNIPKQDEYTLQFGQYQYLQNKNGDYVPVLYEQAYLDGVYASTPNQYFYIGVAEIEDDNGQKIEYDKWQKIETKENATDFAQDWEATNKQFLYTNRIVLSGVNDAFEVADLDIDFKRHDKTQVLHSCATGALLCLAVNEGSVIASVDINELLKTSTYIPARMFANLEFDSDNIIMPADVVIGTNAFPSNIEITIATVE